MINIDIKNKETFTSEDITIQKEKIKLEIKKLQYKKFFNLSILFSINILFFCFFIIANLYFNLIDLFKLLDIFFFYIIASSVGVLYSCSSLFANKYIFFTACAAVFISSFLFFGYLSILATLIISFVLFSFFYIHKIFKNIELKTNQLHSFEYVDQSYCIEIEKFLSVQEISEFRDFVVKNLCRKFIVSEFNAMNDFFCSTEERLYLEEQQKILDQACNNVYMK